MSESVHRADAEALAELRDARERLETAQQRIERQGGGDETAVEDAAAAYRNATELLESYVDRATGTGRENFQAYIELEGKFDSLVDSLDDDLRGREAFEAALDAIDKRRLSESDFERAEAELEPAKEYADLIGEREAAREALGAARTNASQRLGEIDDELAETERLLELSHADFDAPIERLRDPIEAYDEAIREAFEAYRSEAAACEVFAFLDRTRWYPFVEYELPPADLESYVETNPAGEYTIEELLEYAEYTRSKLSHYVDDADELKRQVATQQTYLDGIDAEPLTVGWPPEPAGVLRRQTREYRPFVDRIADEETVSLLREVRLIARDPDYDRLQTAAQAVDQLTPAERRRLADGRVKDELEALRNEREQLAAALDVDDPV
ncbi:hypothetical protein EL22_03830 [Halostagnicola sp. A56]|uniref:DUF7118 family protein n=1 Tax=Halostagnicola sp. A56 TaxID=1495067 RepID=UPI0004A124A4|nr:hypothetical protein [Halostagnicola sp. A56]KDE58581.1 hypothetical protein EL22_03830 [Halostagnicola sp. A56]